MFGDDQLVDNNKSDDGAIVMTGNVTGNWPRYKTIAFQSIVQHIALRDLKVQTDLINEGSYLVVRDAVYANTSVQASRRNLLPQS